MIVIHAFWSDNFSTFYTSILSSNPTFKQLIPKIQHSIVLMPGERMKDVQQGILKEISEQTKAKKDVFTQSSCYQSHRAN